MRSRLLWPLTSGLVLLAWAAGRLMWNPETTDGFGVLPFSWLLDLGVFLVPLPVLLLGVRLRRSVAAGLRDLGALLVAVAVVILLLGTFMSSFGGFCFDPGEDTCVVRPAAHLAHVMTPLVVVLVAWLYAARRSSAATGQGR